MLKIGTSEKLITPKIGIELCGYLARIQPSVGQYDDLYAKVLYAENNGNKILWIHCDLIGFSNDIADSIRKSVAEKTGIETGNVFLSATHTHAGPATVPLRKCGDIDKDYITFLEKMIIEGVADAVCNTEKVDIYFSETTLDGVAIDRRKASKNSHVDNKLPVLAFRRSDGLYKAVIANYGMHNVGLSQVNRYISADIAGFAAKLVNSKIPGKPAVFMTNGGCGNINPISKTDDYSGVEKAGSILGDKIINELPNLKLFNDSEISSLFSTLELSLDVSSLEELEIMMDGHHHYYKSHEDNYENNRLYDALNIWYNETKEMMRNKKSLAPAVAYIHVLKIGPVIFAGINAEVFSKMAEQLRKATGIKRFYVVGYTNGCLGYLAPKEAYMEGGYEINYAYKYYGNFKLAPKCFETIRNEILSKIRKL